MEFPLLPQKRDILLLTHWFKKKKKNLITNTLKFMFTVKNFINELIIGIF